MLHDSAAQRSKWALVPIPCASDCDTLGRDSHWTNLTKKTDLRGKREQSIRKVKYFEKMMRKLGMEGQGKYRNKR